MNRTIWRQNEKLSRIHSLAPAVPNQAGEVVTDLSLTLVLQQIADLSRELVPAMSSGLMIVDNGRRSSFVTSGLSPEEKSALEAHLRDSGISGTLGNELRPTRHMDQDQSSQGSGTPADGFKVTSLLGIPVMNKGRHLGNLYLLNKPGNIPFTQEESSLMSMFATQAAVAIENAENYRNIQVRSIVDERDRIGRDLHDNTIQSLYALGLELDDCAEVATGPFPEVHTRLRRSVGSINEIISSIRTYVLDLRPDDQAEPKLHEYLEELVRTFQGARLSQIDLCWEVGHPLVLSPSQISHLTAIAKEGLANVVKHDGAASATVGLSSEGVWLNLWIEDDGIGFDANALVGSQHQGLRNMRERIHALGGTLQIQSGTGRLTRLNVTVPLVHNAPAAARSGQ
jgi:signal transduction histidine kinase